MNVRRRVQICSVAVTFMGVSALALMTPDRALASSCGTLHFCETATFCQMNANFICTENAPPGCRLGEAFCLFPSQEYCTGSTYDLFCAYE